MKTTSHYKGHRWTDEQLRELMRLWAGESTMEEIQASLQSTRPAILKQIQRMRKAGIPLARRDRGRKIGDINRLWTAGETEYLLRRRNEKATSEEIGAEIGRSPNAVDSMIQKLRSEGVDVKMRGSGVRRLWDAESLKATNIIMQ